MRCSTYCRQVWSLSQPTSLRAGGLALAWLPTTLALAANLIRQPLITHRWIIKRLHMCVYRHWSCIIKVSSRVRQITFLGLSRTHSSHQVRQDRRSSWTSYLDDLCRDSANCFCWCWKNSPPFKATECKGSNKSFNALSETVMTGIDHLSIKQINLFWVRWWYSGSIGILSVSIWLKYRSEAWILHAHHSFGSTYRTTSCAK